MMGTMQNETHLPSSDEMAAAQAGWKPRYDVPPPTIASQFQSGGSAYSGGNKSN